jgi:hypothetical protein
VATGTVDLALPFVLSENNDSNVFSINVNNKRTYVLQAPDETEKHAWLGALQKLGIRY